jgi:hypothetical protein
MGMSRTDLDLVREIESVITDHLAAIKKEAHERVLKLEGIDRDKAWEQISAAVEDYGGDMLTDATYGLRQQAADYAARRWQTVSSSAGRRRD